MHACLADVCFGAHLGLRSAFRHIRFVPGADIVSLPRHVRLVLPDIAWRSLLMAILRD